MVDHQKVLGISEAEEHEEDLDLSVQEGVELAYEQIPDQMLELMIVEIDFSHFENKHQHGGKDRKKDSSHQSQFVPTIHKEVDHVIVLHLMS